MDALEIVRIVMWIVASATTLVTIFLGLVLGYHWNNYSGSRRAAKISILTYTCVALVLALTMFGFIPA